MNNNIYLMFILSSICLLFADPPDWTDDPGAYEFTASMTAVVHHSLTDEQLDDPADILAAFDSDGNVRGIAINLYAPFGPYEGSNLWEMQIRSNAGGDAISFKYYDASADEVLAASPGYTFTVNEIIGNVAAPHEIFYIMISYCLMEGCTTTFLQM